MRTFHPSSWSKQARTLGDKLFSRLENGTLDGERDLVDWFALGYKYGRCKQRRKYVDQRAAKRVCRLIRKGKRK